MKQWIWRMLIFLLLTTTIHGGRQHKYEIIRERDNNICEGTIHDGIATVTQCMAICSAFPGCRGVFYTGRIRRCRCCSNLDVDQFEEGARFYKRDESDVCLDQNSSSSIHAVAAQDLDVCVKKILNVTNGCPFGEWAEPEFCPHGTFAVGYRLKVETNQLQELIDDTAANALELTCQSVDGSKSGGTIRSGEGRYGDWWVGIRCPDNTLIKSFKMQAEPPMYGRFDDNTAVSYVRFLCFPLWADQPFNKLEIPPGEGLFGRNGKFSEICGIGQGVCGLRVRVENKPSSKDNTGLNDVVLYCC